MYRIYTYNKNNHIRTINHYRNSRCYYTMVEVETCAEMEEAITTLRKCGVEVTDIRYGAGGRSVWF